MINEVIILGKYKFIDKDCIEVNHRNFYKVIIEVEKGFKEKNNTFIYDEIVCLFWKGEAVKVFDLKSPNLWISVKWRLAVYNDQMYVIAEKVKYINQFD